MRRFKISIPRVFRKSRTPSTGMAAIRKRLGRASRVGSAVLLILSAALALTSYRYPNLVIEVDSVVAFAAAIVLLYRDTTHSVQLRVVDRILESSRELTQKLASLSLNEREFCYLQKGSKVQDVIVLASKIHGDTGGEPVSDPESVELVPPGRSLAQLFLRDMPVENPDLDALVRVTPEVVSTSLGLASAASITRSKEIVEVRLLNPVLKNSCNTQGQMENSLACEMCSLFAVLICNASQRIVTVESCSSREGNISVISYRLGAQSSQESK